LICGSVESLACRTRLWVAGLYTHVWQLAWTLRDYLDRRADWQHQVTLAMAAVAANEQLGDPAGLAHAHRFLGPAYSARRSIDHDHLLLSMSGALMRYYSRVNATRRRQAADDIAALMRSPVVDGPPVAASPQRLADMAGARTVVVPLETVSGTRVSALRPRRAKGVRPPR
jgi:hypothetical protein